MRICAMCKEEKPASPLYFQKHSGHSDGLGPYCRPCHRKRAREDYQKKREHYRKLAIEYRNAHKEERHAYDRERNRKAMLMAVGITEEDYAIVLRNQGGLCGLCKGLLTTQRIDHDHKTGKFRGILCQKCNTGLGALGDGVDGLQLAIEYLRRSEFVLVHKETGTS